MEDKQANFAIYKDIDGRSNFILYDEEDGATKDLNLTEAQIFKQEYSILKDLELIFDGSIVTVRGLRRQKDDKDWHPQIDWVTSSWAIYDRRKTTMPAIPIPPNTQK